ncbi:hypothetical protein [Psychroserpens algicola]|uniref:hypothetical protein n=1 Tax=Psychroserpens algicola TaxID=1719034 RepID=UPI0019531098|nr:hypothetical protein [Psychroserpens algicola]
MAKANNFGLPVEYPQGKDKALQDFIDLTLTRAPRYDKFNVYSLAKELELSDLEIKQYQELSFDIRKHLVLNNYAEFQGSNKIYLTDKGRDYSKPTKPLANVTNNDFSNSTIGSIAQSSRKIEFNKPIKQNIVHKTENTASKNSWIEKLSWIIGIILGLILIYEFIIKQIMSNN